MSPDKLATYVGFSFNRAMDLLLVEDDELVRETIKDVLMEIEGVRPTLAYDGSHAFEKLKSKNFDLVITDINMPEMNGLELLLNIRELGQRTLVIVCTAHASKENILTALRLQAFDVLEKPFHSQQLQSAVRRAMEYIKETQRSWTKDLPLSAQQIVILNHLLDHRSNTEISELVSLKEPTVKYHIGIILNHFGVKSRTKLKEIVSRRGA